MQELNTLLRLLAVLRQTSQQRHGLLATGSWGAALVCWLFDWV